MELNKVITVTPIMVWCVHLCNGTIAGIFDNENDAFKLVNTKYNDEFTEVIDHIAIKTTDNMVYLLNKSYDNSYPLNVDLNEQRKDKIKEALSKLKMEEIEMLGLAGLFSEVSED